MDSQQPASAPFEGSAPRTPEMRALLCADLVDSTALVERLGDIPAAELIRRHDRLARDLVHRHGGQEIDKTDGFLLLFNRALDAVAFALAYQRALRELGVECGQPLRARVGIHLGEVLIWQNAAADVSQGAKPVEVEGLAKPVAARLMGLALPGQVLLSGAAFNLAQRAAGELGDAARSLRWLTHGRYRFKGVPQPQLVHEVGEVGFAPLRSPPSSAKAWRDVPLWRRPAALAIEALAAVLLIGFALGMLLRPVPVIAFAERDWVVVGDLQNLTGDASLDDALDSAFRLGLEQSRHVNVLPRSQVQQALARMQKPGTAVDRQIGVELAMREGARALILPSVAEVGGRLRVMAEVVEPASGASVYSESAQGEGVHDILPAMDTVLAGLRGKLGESVGSIRETGQPLAQVTTADIDALRAFSRAEQRLAVGAVGEAVTLLNHALEIDPEFAMARLRLGTIHHAYLSDSTAAAGQWQRARDSSDRLSVRERLALDALLATLESPARMRERWTLLLNMYPDTDSAHNNLGLVALWYENDPAQAERHYRDFANTRSIHRGFGWLGLMVAQLRQGKVDDARESRKQAEILAALGPRGDEFLIELASGELDAGLEKLAGQPGAGLPMSVKTERDLRQVAFLARAGRHADALDLTRRLAGRPDLSPALLARIELARIALLQTSGEDSDADSSRQAVAGLVEAAARSGEPRPAVATALIAALLLGDDPAATELRRAVHEGFADATGDSGFPLVASLHRALGCTLQSEATPRADCFESESAGSPFPVFQFRLRAMQASDHGGETGRAADIARWLVANPGAAVTEFGDYEVQVSNLIGLHEARVVLAEALLKAEDLPAARDLLADPRREGEPLPAPPSLEARQQRVWRALLEQQEDQAGVAFDLGLQGVQGGL
jgi:putative peptide modification system cyclase